MRPEVRRVLAPRTLLAEPPVLVRLEAIWRLTQERELETLERMYRMEAK